MGKPRVLFLTEGRNSPSTRFAVCAFLPYLEKQGIDYYVAHRRPEKYILIDLPFFNYRPLRLLIYALVCYPFSLLRRFITLFKIPFYEITFLQRDLDENHTTPWLERLFRRHSENFIFYFDDALWLGKNHFGQPLERKIRETIRLADWVIVSHEYLADYARQFNKSVLIFPMAIDTNVYSPCPDNLNNGKIARINRKVTLGWSGGPWNYGELLELADTLAEIKKEVDVDIIIHSGEPPPQVIQKLGVIYLPWQRDKEVEVLRRMDIALCPLRDSPWARGKYSIKLLQYLAVGLPVVCSDAGVNGEIIIDGSVGFVVRTKEEWRSRLLTLIYDQKKREQMAESARQRAVENYSLDKAGGRLVDFLFSFKTKKIKNARFFILNS